MEKHILKIVLMVGRDKKMVSDEQKESSKLDPKNPYDLKGNSVSPEDSTTAQQNQPISKCRKPLIMIISWILSSGRQHSDVLLKIVL